MLVNENGANEIDDGTLGLFPLPKRSSLRGPFLDHTYIYTRRARSSEIWTPITYVHTCTYTRECTAIAYAFASGIRLRPSSLVDMHEDTRPEILARLEPLGEVGTTSRTRVPPPSKPCIGGLTSALVSSFSFFLYFFLSRYLSRYTW